MMQRDWVEELLRWAPDVANEPTFLSSKPCGWTPLQCLVDNPIPDEADDEILEEVKKTVSDLVEHMTQEALANTSGRVTRAGGKQSGGQNALHALASRTITRAFFHTAGRIEHRFGREFLAELLNKKAADGRGVVDFALGSKVAFAMEIKRIWPLAKEQVSDPKATAATAAKTSHPRWDWGWDSTASGQGWDWDCKASGEGWDESSGSAQGSGWWQGSTASGQGWHYKRPRWEQGDSDDKRALPVVGKPDYYERDDASSSYSPSRRESRSRSSRR